MTDAERIELIRRPDPERLRDWLLEEPRRQPFQAFIAGPERVLADWINVVIAKAVAAERSAERLLIMREASLSAVGYRHEGNEEAARVLESFVTFLRFNHDKMGL